MEIMLDEELKRLIIRKVIKTKCKLDGCCIRYCGKLYYVNVKENKVVPALEYK